MMFALVSVRTKPEAPILALADNTTFSANVHFKKGMIRTPSRTSKYVYFRYLSNVTDASSIQIRKT